jgi:hypothetical protein
MSEHPGAYYTPGKASPIDGLQTPPYITRTQQIAALGIELAGLHRHMHDTAMKLENVNAITHRVEWLVAEILKLAEEGKPSNE